MTLVSLETYEAILRVLILPFWNEAGLGLGGGGWGWGWDLILTHAKNTLAKKKKKKRKQATRPNRRMADQRTQTRYSI